MFSLSYRVAFAVLLYFFLTLAVLKADTVVKIDVLAIEYPPYTSELIRGGGLAFQKLSQSLSNTSPGPSGWVINARFVPPARANYLISTGDWAASFYPPLQPNDDYYWFQLDRGIVELGLFRRKNDNAEPGVWPALDLLEGRVATGRQADLKGAGIVSSLTASKLQIFQVDSLTQGFQMLAKGRVDYVFAEKKAGYFIAAQLGIEKESLEFIDKPLTETRIGLWVNRANPHGRLLYQLLDRQEGP